MTAIAEIVKEKRKSSNESRKNKYPVSSLCASIRKRGAWKFFKKVKKRGPGNFQL